MIDLVPVEETVFYKEVFEEGGLRKAVEKIDSSVSSFQELLEGGYIPSTLYEQKVQPLLEERRRAIARLKVIG